MIEHNLIEENMNFLTHRDGTVERENFIKQVRKSIMETKLVRGEIRNLREEVHAKMKDRLDSEALGTSVFLEDEEAYKKLINTVYKDVAPPIFSNMYGEIEYFNGEALYMLYKYVKRYGNKTQKEYLGVLMASGTYFCINRETEALEGVASVTKPFDLKKMSCDPQRFGSTKAPYMTRKYMEYAIVAYKEAGIKNAYTYDARRELYIHAVSSIMGKSLEEVEAIVNKRTQGLFTRFLHIEEEIKLIKFILDFKMYKSKAIYNGVLSEGYVKDLTHELGYEYASLEHIGKGREGSIRFMGAFLNTLASKVNQRGINVDVYSITDTQLSFQTDVPLEQFSPALLKSVTPIYNLTLDYDIGYF